MINNISFTGRREVLYGLEKAAKSASEYEIYSMNSRGPYSVTDLRQVYAAKAKTDAYMDMIYHDEAFSEAVSNIPEKLIYKLKTLLSPFKDGFNFRNPKKALEDSFKTVSDHDVDAVKLTAFKRLMSKFVNFEDL